MFLVQFRLNYNFHWRKLTGIKAESKNSLAPAPTSLLKKFLSVKTLGKSKRPMLLAAV